MKTLKFIIYCFALTVISGTYLFGQTNKQSQLTILNMDVQGLNISPEEAGNLVRLEMEKLDTFVITDRYDVNFLIKNLGLEVEGCYGKICQVELGKALHTDLMLSGTFEQIGKSIIISFRLIDVNENKIVKSETTEYLPIPENLQVMVQISLRKLIGLKVSEEVENSLTKISSFESAINNPNVARLNLSGPRSGFSFVTGETRQVLQKPLESGGYDAYPILYMVGYQFEMQYLNEGKYQALFEIVPAISGFTGNVFRPSLNILNGFRNNKSGWEFAFGPTFGVSTYSYGAYDANGNWINEYNIPYTEKDKMPIIKRMDSNGEDEITTNLLFAIGKSFKSGKVNIPVNVFFIPSKSGSVVGFTFGFNSKRNY